MGLDEEYEAAVGGANADEAANVVRPCFFLLSITEIAIGLVKPPCTYIAPSCDW